MRRTAFLFALSCAVVVRAATPALMPMPANVELAAGHLPIDAGFGVAADSVRLAPAVKRFLARVFRQTGIFPAPSDSAATLSRVPRLQY